MNDYCPHCGLPLRDPNCDPDQGFPTTRERLREAEQALIDAGDMLAKMDRRVAAAEARAVAAETRAAAEMQ
jgi:hypothetical protein